jgi:hypothetical protein
VAALGNGQDALDALVASRLFTGHLCGAGGAGGRQGRLARGLALGCGSLATDGRDAIAQTLDGDAAGGLRQGAGRRQSPGLVGGFLGSIPFASFDGLFGAAQRSPQFEDIELLADRR